MNYIQAVGNKQNALYITQVKNGFKVVVYRSQAEINAEQQRLFLEKKKKEKVKLRKEDIPGFPDFPPELDKFEEKTLEMMSDKLDKYIATDNHVMPEVPETEEIVFSTYEEMEKFIKLYLDMPVDRNLPKRI